jgi:hypothetical protein
MPLLVKSTDMAARRNSQAPGCVVTRAEGEVTRKATRVAQEGQIDFLQLAVVVCLTVTALLIVLAFYFL